MKVDVLPVSISALTSRPLIKTGTILLLREDGLLVEAATAAAERIAGGLGSRASFLQAHRK